jgi:hypothetical protein
VCRSITLWTYLCRPLPSVSNISQGQTNFNSGDHDTYQCHRQCLKLIRACGHECQLPCHEKCICYRCNPPVVLYESDLRNHVDTHGAAAVAAGMAAKYNMTRVVIPRAEMSMQGPPPGLERVLAQTQRSTVGSTYSELHPNKRDDWLMNAYRQSQQDDWIAPELKQPPWIAEKPDKMQQEWGHSEECGDSKQGLSEGDWGRRQRWSDQGRRIVDDRIGGDGPLRANGKERGQQGGQADIESLINF